MSVLIKKVVNPIHLKIGKITEQILFMISNCSEFEMR